MFKSVLKKKSGYSILELTIAMMVGSILVSSAFQTHRYFMRSISRENEKAQLQRDIAAIANFLEKDIRMSGLGLPGNGFKLVLSTSASDEIQIFLNPEHLKTNLSADASTGADRILVDDGGIIQDERWICIQSHDTTFREILRVGIDVAGVDTFFLASNLDNTYPASNTTIYPARRIAYYVQNVPQKALYRKTNSTAVRLSELLDTLNCVPKDKSGTPLSGSQIASARILSVIFGGKIGSGTNEVLIADSTEVNIRNSL